MSRSGLRASPATAVIPRRGKIRSTASTPILNKVYTYPYLKTDPDLGKATLTPTRIKNLADALHTIQPIPSSCWTGGLWPGGSGPGDGPAAGVYW